MNLDKKGFVSTALLYSLLLLFLALILGLLSLLSNRKQILDKLKGDIKNEINETKVYKTYENGYVIYYNPVDGQICGNYLEENSKTGVKKGCMKWYVFNDDKNKAMLNIILDHNTTDKVYFNSTGSNTEIKELKTALESDTKNWKQNARLIEADEIAKITNNKSFKGIETKSDKWFCFDTNETDTTNSCKKAEGTSNYSWLFNNTNECKEYGCSVVVSDTFGYWTSTKTNGDSKNSWIVDSSGSLKSYSVSNNDKYGVRPVISIPKKIFENIKLEVLYDYTGTEQTFTAPISGKYKLETWGAQGGSILNTISGKTYGGGYGGYSSGIINLEKNYSFFINVGGSGKSCLKYGTTTSGTTTCPDDGGYNGGGSTRQYTKQTFYGSGGGATHISLKSGLLKDLENYKNSILVVSGGGGGASSFNENAYSAQGGSSGGYVGSKSVIYKIDRDVDCSGGTQTESGNGSDTINSAFGQGGSIGRYVGPGAGGGYYGGGTSEIYSCGGSSYIGNSKLTDKVMYCYNCEESKEESTKTVSTTCTKEEPTENCAKQGNGYAKITYLGESDN